MDEDDETEVNARPTSSPPAPYDKPPPAQLDDSFVATFQQCKPPNPTCYLWKDMKTSNLEEGRALNSWLIGL